MICLLLKVVKYLLSADDRKQFKTIKSVKNINDLQRKLILFQIGKHKLICKLNITAKELGFTCTSSTKIFLIIHNTY